MTHRQFPDLRGVALRWLPRAEQHAEENKIDPRVVEGAVRYPTSWGVDPSCALIEGDRWYAERRRRGDVTVVVAFPPGEEPVIWGVYHNLPMRHSRARQRAPGSGGGTTMPTSMRELRRRLIDAGLVITSGGKHDRVSTPEGAFIAALPSTPSDVRTIPNLVRDIARKGIDVS